MASTKKKATAKAAAKFKDLKSKKNPKGGAFDAYMKANTATSQASAKKGQWIE